MKARLTRFFKAHQLNNNVYSGIQFALHRRQKER